MPKHYHEALRLDSDPKWVRLIPGVYPTDIYIPERDEVISINLPFYKYRRHYDQAIRKMIPCSAGADVDFGAKPCIGCTKGLPAQDSYAYTAIWLSWFHATPWVKDNKVQMSKATGKPITNLEPCEGANCKMCRTGTEKQFGRRMHLSLGYTQRNYLSAKEESLRGYCKCGEEIDIVKMLCPQCGRSLIDCETTELSAKDIKEIRKNGMMCPTCKRTMKLIDEYSCSCGDPRPLTIFDVDIKIDKIDVGDAKGILEIEFNKPSPIDPKYTGDKEPYNFAEVFAPPNVESQRLIYNYQGPITNAETEKAAVEY